MAVPKKADRKRSADTISSHLTVLLLSPECNQLTAEASCQRNEVPLKKEDMTADERSNVAAR